MKMKREIRQPVLKTKPDEQGSALVIALIILVLLTLIGISATRTSQIETQIAGNERSYMRVFYVSDSAWKEGMVWLDTQATPPVPINFQNPLVVPSGTTDLESITASDFLNIRNYGNVSGTMFDPATDNPPPGTPDGTLGLAPRTTDYWYKAAFYQAPGQTFSNVMEGQPSGSARAGLGASQREYTFILTGNANAAQEISVTVRKKFSFASSTGY
jgi:hypothetical protein